MTINEEIKCQRDKIIIEILEVIEGNTAEWKSGLYDKIPEAPSEDINGNKFQGIQQLTLRLESIHRGYRDPRWLTAYEAQKLGAQINKGAKPVKIHVWKRYDKITNTFPDWNTLKKLSNEDYEKYLKDNVEFRKYTIDVFNAEQCVGLKPYVPPRLQMVNDKIEKIISNLKMF